MCDSPGNQTSDSSGQSKRRASTPPQTTEKERRRSRGSPQPPQGSSNEQRWGRSRSPHASAKESHDSLDRPDSQLSSYSQSSWEQAPIERRERGQQRERNESFSLSSSSRYAGRFGSRGSGEETESTHRRETGTRKRRDSSPVASFKRSREDTQSEERKINIFDRLGPSSSHKEKLHSMETFGDIAFSTSPTSGKQLSASIGGDIGREGTSLVEKYEGTLGFSAEYEHRSLSGESVGRRRGREILSVKEEFGEKGSEKRERGRERERRRHSYRDVKGERTTRERERGRDVWGREREKEKEWYRRQRDREKTSKNEKDTDKIHSRSEQERERRRERETDADIHWQPMETIDYERETREEEEEEGEENGGRKQLEDGQGRRGEEERGTNGRVEEEEGGTPCNIREREVRENEDALEELGEGEGGEGERRRGRLRSRGEEGETERREEDRGRGSQKGKERERRRWVSPEFENGYDAGDHATPIAEMQPILEGRKRVAEGEGATSPMFLPDSRDYSERDVTPPLEVLQSMQQSSYQQAFFPGHFPLPPTNDIAFHMFAGANQLTSSAPPPPLPSSMPLSLHYSQSSPLLAPAVPLGFLPPVPPGTGSGWGLPPGVTPTQWQLWIQNISQPALPAEPATSVSLATFTGATASAEQRVSLRVGSGVAELPAESVEETPTQREATPSRPELGPVSPGNGETEPLPASSRLSSPSPLPPSSRVLPPSPPPPAKKRRLDQQCRADYRAMMQVWTRKGAIACTLCTQIRVM